MKRKINVTLGLLWSLSLLASQAWAQANFQQVVRYLGAEDYMEHATFLDSSQTLISLGYVTDSNNQDMLMASDVHGNVQWQQLLVDGPNSFYSMQYLCTEGNGIFVAGEADGADLAAAIHKFDAAGNRAWTRDFTYNPAYIFLTALAGDHQGNVVFGGQEEDVIFSANGMVGKLRASDGAELWMSTINDSVEIIVDEVTATSSGEVIAAGMVSNFPTSSAYWAWVAKWDQNGVLQWCKKIDDRAYIYGLQADDDWIYLGGSSFDSLAGDHMFIARFTQAGGLSIWQNLNNPSQSSYLNDLKLDDNGLAMVVNYQDGNIEDPILMRMDTAFNVIYAWQDNFAAPFAIAGTDSNGILHFVGSYFLDSLNDESIVLGGFPDAPISGIPCGMQPFAPQWTAHNPLVSNYAVTTATTSRSGYGQVTTYSLPITPLTDCATATAVAEPVGEVQAWPNPTTDRLHVRLPQGECSVELLDLDGKLRLQASGSDVVDLDMASVAAGIYLLRVRTNDQVWTKRISRIR